MISFQVLSICLKIMSEKYYQAPHFWLRLKSNILSISWWYGSKDSVRHRLRFKLSRSCWMTGTCTFKFMILAINFCLPQNKHQVRKRSRTLCCSLKNVSFAKTSRFRSNELRVTLNFRDQLTYTLGLFAIVWLIARECRSSTRMKAQRYKAVIAFGASWWMNCIPCHKNRTPFKGQRVAVTTRCLSPKYANWSICWPKVTLALFSQLKKWKNSRKEHSVRPPRHYKNKRYFQMIP